MSGTLKRPELIVALDVEKGSEALGLAGELGGKADWFKIGSRLFTAEGPAVVSGILKRGMPVFLDLKFHDIPATVAGAVRAASGLGVSMMTVHTSGGLHMMKAAADAAARASENLGVNRPLVVGVTLLTSLSAEDLATTTDYKGELTGMVLRLAARAREAGLDGVVASVEEASRIKDELGDDFIVVTPGIRPAEAAAGDQKRVATPERAAASGADYIVVGRPIIHAPSPARAAESILVELGRK
jgi:orotidine-5'-phosphate decarboxylase